MKIPNIKSEQYERFWDDGQRGPTYYRWYKKGFYKRYFRKKFIKNFLKSI